MVFSNNIGGLQRYEVSDTVPLLTEKLYVIKPDFFIKQQM